MHDKIVLMVKNRVIDVMLQTGLHIGTNASCHVRLQRNHFFDAFDVRFVRRQDVWYMDCGEAVYVTVGGVKKKAVCLTQYGQEYILKYEQFNLEVCRVVFMPQVFDSVPVYNAYIALGLQDNWLIGDSVQADVHIEKINQWIQLRHIHGEWVLEALRHSDAVVVNNQLMTLPYTLKEHDFFKVHHVSFYFREGRLYVDERLCKGVSSTVLTPMQSEMFQTPIWVYQSPRYAPVYHIEHVPITVNLPNKEPFDAYRLASLLPLSMMFVAAMFFGTSMSGSVYPLMTMGVTFFGGVLQSGVMYIQHNNRYKQTKKQYVQALSEAEMTMQSLQAKETLYRTKVYHFMAPLDSQSVNVFDRQQSDEDFLHIYLGKGRVKSQHQFESHHGKTGDMMLLQQRYEWLEDVPVTVSLQEQRYIGVVGDRLDTEHMMKHIVLDIAMRHQPSDVRCVLLGDETVDLSWARWLPHVQDTQTLERFISDTPQKSAMLLDKVQNMVGKTVVCVWGRTQLLAHPIFHQLDQLLDVYVIVVEETIRDLPVVCTRVIRLKQEVGDVFNVQQDDSESTFQCTFLSPQQFFDAVCMLGNTRSQMVADHHRIPSQVGWYDLLQVFSSEDLNVLDRWQQNRYATRLSVPIGKSGANEGLYLDVSDDQHGHGPHGLIAGTTGSGKSECVQTYIAMMMATYHPHDVTFLLIDFKGGGMSRLFADLPHVVGTLTNLDAHDMMRALLFIKAEITKRQKCFLDKGVSHIVAYQQCMAAGEQGETLAHLIIVIDEFAELKMAYPEWMQELVSIARIGRTLGIHLILATQKPSGVVDAQIWSNARFKICLKVQTKEDSHDMIKSDLAVFLKEPGRAYLQVGQEPVTLFQSGYGGVRVPTHTHERAYKVYERQIGGAPICVYETDETRHDDTQVYQLLTLLKETVINAHIQPLPAVLLPPLPTDVLYEVSDVIGHLFIGICDDPTEQQQRSCYVNATQHVLIVGAVQTGKTTVLQTLLYGLLHQEKTVHVYVIDCGQGQLKRYAQNTGVGDVINHDEREKYRCFRIWIERMIQERKQQIQDGTIENELPHIVVMIDQLSACVDCFPESIGFLERVLREGERVGITCMMTAEHVQTLPYRLQLCIRQKISLYSSDKHDYYTMVGTSQLLPNIPGRCWIRQGEGVYACQIARVTDDIMAYDKHHAPPIPMIPHVLNGGDVPYKPHHLALGLDYDRITVAYTHFSDKPLLIVGRPQLRTAYMLSLLRWIQLYRIVDMNDVYIVDSPNKSLQAYAHEYNVSQYCVGDAAITDIAQWCAVIRTHQRPTLVVINDQHVLAESVVLKELVEYAQETEIMMIIGDVTNESMAFTTVTHMTWLKTMTRGILCDDITFNRFFDHIGGTKRHKHEKGMVYDMSDMTVKRLKMYTFERG